MREYFVNVFADVIPGDSPYQKTLVAAYHVQADTDKHAADVAVAEVIKGNRPIDTMTIKYSAVYPVDEMPLLTYMEAIDNENPCSLRGIAGRDKRASGAGP